MHEKILILYQIFSDTSTNLNHHLIMGFSIHFWTNVMYEYMLPLPFLKATSDYFIVSIACSFLLLFLTNMCHKG